MVDLEVVIFLTEEGFWENTKFKYGPFEQCLYQGALTKTINGIIVGRWAFNVW